MRPLIGITMRQETATERFYLARYYSEAVESAGGAPVHLPLIPDADCVASLAERLDGVLLPGSASDVDPLLYEREPRPRLGEVHPERDETDALLLAQVERRRLPLFAICYGLQIWNVVRGGTLIQDIETELPEAVKHEQGQPRDRHSHRISILPGSILAEHAQSESALVNSHHHQAVASLGRDLRATAWTADGLIEGVEDVRRDRWALGVQWHPEIGWRKDQFSTRLFTFFVRAAQRYSEEKATLKVSLEQDAYGDSAPSPITT